LSAILDLEPETGGDDDYAEVGRKCASRQLGGFGSPTILEFAPSGWFSQDDSLRSSETSHFYRMAIAWNLDGVSAPIGLLADVVTGVARLAKFVVAPAQNAEVICKRATVTRPDANLRCILDSVHFHSLAQSLRNPLTEFPQKIVATPTIDPALLDGTRMIQFCSDGGHPSFQAGDRCRRKVADTSGPVPKRAGKIVSPTFQSLRINRAGKVLFVESRRG
jgi:hypothetical protein